MGFINKQVLCTNRLMAHVPSSPRKLYNISASDQEVRKYLKDSFKEISDELKKRHKEVKPHLKPFLKRLDSMPDFWMQLPRQVEREMQEYGEALGKKDGEDKLNNWVEVATAAEKVAGRCERRGERVPTIIKVIRLANKLANHPTHKQADLEDQLARITKAIQRNTLTPEQKEDADREKRKARREEKRAVEEEKKKEKKAKRLSLNSPLQPLDTVLGTPGKSTLEQKREWRKSYDPKMLGPVKVNPAALKQNPQFGIIGVYKQRALLNNLDTGTFDTTVENKVLPQFQKLEGRSADALRADLKALFNQPSGPDSLRPGTLAADPHQLLKKSSTPLAADPLQLYPVFVRMLVRAGLEAQPIGTKLPFDKDDYAFPMVAGTPYLCTKEFEEDYKQLQAALRLKTEAILKNEVPDNANLATVEELKKTLSSPGKNRKGLEKQDSATEQDSSTPRTDPEVSEKSKPRKLNKRETTTTTTTTATTTTTTIGTTGPMASPVKSPSQKGLVRLYSASNDDMSLALKPTFESVVGQLNAVYEKYGPHAGSGAMKLLVALKELYELSSRKEARVEEMLPLAIKEANLTTLEKEVLTDAGSELASKRAKPIGRSEQARFVGEFIIQVQRNLTANLEKVND